MDNTTYEDDCLIACPEPYISEAIHQLAQERTDQIVLSGFSIIEIVYPTRLNQVNTD